MAFDPETSGSSVESRALDMLARHPAYLDLAKALKGGTQQVAYLRTEIDSDRRASMCLEIFSDDGVKAWLNGKPVHANNVSRGIAQRPDAVDVTLKKGTNDLLLKATQDTGPWDAIVRMRPRGDAESARD